MRRYLSQTPRGTLFLVLFLLGFLAIVTGISTAQELPIAHPGKPTNYAQFLISDKATIAPDAVAETLSDLSRQGDHFDHIVVMTHGFDLDEPISKQQLEWLSDKFLREFTSKGAQKVGLVGVQWHSVTHATLFPLGGDYLRKVALARSSGRGPARQLLLALQDRYPDAHISLLGHSTGCELTTAALVPELDYEGTEPFVEAYQPERELKVLMHMLIGSDTDYDLYSRGKVSAEQTIGRCSMVWQTMVPLVPKEKDKVLTLRSHFIARPAGNRLPKLTPEQLDAAVSGRRWMIDSQEIPLSHMYLDYLSDGRVQRMADTMKFLANPKAPKPAVLQRLDAVLAAPEEVDELVSYLDDEDAGVTFYSAWRLEKLLCPNAHHLGDDTYENIVEMLRSRPQKIWRTHRDSQCTTIRKGIFPSAKMMTAAGAPPWARPEKWR